MVAYSSCSSNWKQQRRPSRKPGRTCTAHAECPHCRTFGVIHEIVLSLSVDTVVVERVTHVGASCECGMCIRWLYYRPDLSVTCESVCVLPGVEKVRFGGVHPRLAMQVLLGSYHWQSTLSAAFPSATIECLSLSSITLAGKPLCLSPEAKTEIFL